MTDFKNMKNKSRLSYKIFTTVFLTFSTLFFCSGWVSYSLIKNNVRERVDDNLAKTVSGIRQMVEASTDFSARNYLRSLAEHFVGVTKQLDIQVRAEETDIKKAQNEVLRRLSAIKIGVSGYAYVINTSGVIVGHPSEDLRGKDVSNHDFVQKQMELKKGYIAYEWQNPEDEAFRKKVLYMEYYEPWDWIISISAYTDELGLLVDPGDFRELVLSIDIGENGYPFILSRTGAILIHPTFTGNVARLYEDGRKVLEEMIATGKGKMYYDFFEEDVQKNKKKIAIYETIESNGWIVAGTGYIDDFYQPLIVLKKLFIALVFVVFFLSVAVSIFLSRSVVGPIRELLQNLSNDSDQFHVSEIHTGNKNEIEELTTYFLEYTKQINYQNEKLSDLLAEQKKVVLDLNIFREVFENLAEGISITDIHGTITQVNPAFERITGYSRNEAIGQNPRILRSGHHSADFFEEMWSGIREKGYWTGEIWNKRKNGEVYPEWLTISVVKNRDGIISNYAAIFKDISEITKQRERISFLAYHDHLTSLPNRLMVAERIGEAISEFSRNDSKLLCIVLDIEDFKTISDTLGQEKGDILLTLFVERMKPILRAEDVFGRIGNDDFAILVKSDGSYSNHLESLLDRIFSISNFPIHLDDHAFHITLSIGVAVYPGDGDTEDKILSNAILAMNNAEKTKGNSYRFYNQGMEIKVKKRIKYLAKIREGLKNGEFIPYYQPKVSLASGQIIGVEALARWKSGNDLVSPGEFIPVAEESRLIVEMSWQLYERAFSDCLQLLRDDIEIPVSVNISPYQLQVDTFIQDFLAVQQSTGLESKYIDLEITESALHEKIDYVQELLETIAQAGFSLSIDDFGTGYSSLRYLKSLPFNTLKIDMSFISGIGVDFDDEQIVRTITLLAKQFGMSIVAEGIENLEQVEFLKSLGCDQGQGYHYAKPMEFEELRHWIVRNNTMTTV